MLDRFFPLCLQIQKCKQRSKQIVDHFLKKEKERKIFPIVENCTDFSKSEVKIALKKLTNSCLSFKVGILLSIDKISRKIVVKNDEFIQNFNKMYYSEEKNTLTKIGNIF
jgi:hypothetical protein